MENTPQQELIPLEQAVVLFHGNEVLGVHLSDDRVAATLHSLCSILGILPHGQIQRIRRDKDLVEHLLHAFVKTPGGLQLMDVLVAEKIPDWVIGLQLSRIAPERRPLILALKVEIVDLLHSRFFSDQVAQSSKSQAEPSFRSSASTSDVVSNSPWDRLFAALYDIRQEDEAKTGRLVKFEQWLTSLDRRVAGAGQESAVGLGWIPLLTAAHLADARALLRSLEEATGRTQAQLEQEMLETFGAPAVNALPDEQWPDVLAWALWRARQPDEREGSEPL